MLDLTLKPTPDPYIHQVEAKEFVKDLDIFALFMEQGTGKSRVAIDKIASLFANGIRDSFIIISPNSTTEQWVMEQMQEHFPYLEWEGFIWDGIKTKRSKEEFFKKIESNKLFVFSVNVEAFQSEGIEQWIKYILINRNPFVIVDESTRIKNGRRKPSRGKRAGAKRTNRILDLFERVPYKAILTGTPTPRSPFDLWAQFEFLKKDFFGMDYFFFTHHYGILVSHRNVSGQKYQAVLTLQEYNIVKHQLKKLEKLTPQSIEEIAIRNGIGTQDVLKIHHMKEYSGYKNLDELKKKIEPITFFKKKKDCLDLPDKVYERLLVEMGRDQKQVYDNIKKQMYAEYAGRELTVTNKMVMAMRLQMVTGGLFPYSTTEIKVGTDGEEYFDTHFDYELIKDNAKIRVLLEDLEEVPEETSVIIWAVFRGEVEFIEKSLTEAGYSCCKFYGSSGDEVITNFKNGEFRILVATASKGGMGLNLQVATLHYFYSNSFKADDRLQAEDRSHRIGQTNKVLYKDLICKGTIDEHVYEVLKRKEDLINYFREKSIEDILK